MKNTAGESFDLDSLQTSPCIIWKHGAINGSNLPK